MLFGPASSPYYALLNGSMSGAGFYWEMHNRITSQFGDCMKLLGMKMWCHGRNRIVGLSICCKKIYLRVYWADTNEYTNKTLR
jgi:hypothetical protein